MKSVTFIRNVVLLVSFFLVLSAGAFAPPTKVLSPLTLIYATGDSSPDPKEIIGKTITIRGDVNGGYVRTCIKNEVSQSTAHMLFFVTSQANIILSNISFSNFIVQASKFRRLIGTMSPPTDDDTATVYVEVSNE